VRGDADLLRRALENVLRNAVKHSPRGAAVEVCGRVDAEVCCVAISDRGPGVAESELVSIFEPFYRGAGAARQGEGYGLGLAIAKSVMQRHRGTVAACNRSGGGLVVSLCLPRG
jgi:signal transduction histidine kinase